MTKATFFRTAPAILAGAVLIYGCDYTDNAVSQGDTIDQQVLQMVNSDSIQATMGKDSMAWLGSTGYKVNLPGGFVITSPNDTSFTISPMIRDTGCAQNLRLIFGHEPDVPKPVTEPFNSVYATVLGSQRIFREYGRYDDYCRYRTGLVQVDSTFNIRVHCDAPPDGRMEKIFGIAISLQKSD